MRILFADDDVYERMRVEVALKSAGHDVVITKSGEEFLATLKTDRHEAI